MGGKGKGREGQISNYCEGIFTDVLIVDQIFSSDPILCDWELVITLGWNWMIAFSYLQHTDSVIFGWKCKTFCWKGKIFCWKVKIRFLGVDHFLHSCEMGDMELIFWTNPFCNIMMLHGSSTMFQCSFTEAIHDPLPQPNPTQGRWETSLLKFATLSPISDKI